MTVRAKFFVSSIEHVGTPGSDPCATVRLKPVYGTYGDDESNKTWSKYTPNGSIEMTITNPDATSQFSVGDAYFVDFTPA